MNYKTILIVLGVALFIASCHHTRPIVNVTDAPIISVVGKQLTADQVGSGIVSAGSALGWTMTAVSPGLLSGRLVKDDHVAVVEIRYTEKMYSITYKDSTNLRYKNGQIHKTYNDWVENLDRDIKNTLLRM
jgi:hypothetical protein